MSAETLKKNITRILDERNWSLPDLEKKAGTNRNVYEIIRGRNTNPSAQLVSQIADTLNVDFKELLKDNNEQEYIKNYTLVAEACSLVIEELKSLPTNLNISYSALALLIQEVCSYATQNENKHIDKHFVKWLIMKYYSPYSL